MVLQVKKGGSGLPPKQPRGLSSRSFGKHSAGKDLNELMAKVAKVSKNVGKLIDDQKFDRQKQRLRKLRLGNSSSRHITKNTETKQDSDSETSIREEKDEETKTDLRMQFRNSKNKFSSSNSVSSTGSCTSTTSYSSINSASSRSSVTPKLSLQKTGSSRSIRSGRSTGRSSSSLGSGRSTSSNPPSARSLVRQLSNSSLIEQIGSDSEWAITIKGVKPKNDIHPNENVFVMKTNFGKEGVDLFGVFDGHGKHGLSMAEISSKSMVDMLEKAEIYASRPKAEVLKRFTKAFLHASKTLSKSQTDISFSGTTASMVVYDKKIRTLKIANVGDTRVVLAVEQGTRIVGEQLTQNHSPDDPEEKNRIQKKGGVVSAPKYDLKGKLIDPPRVWLPSGRVPGLAMSRSLGDSVAHKIGVSCQPDVTISQVEQGALFLIIANGGLWQQITTQEAVNIIAKNSIAVRDSSFNAKSAAETLGNEAMKRWQALSPDGVIDDITCVVVKL